MSIELILITAFIIVTFLFLQIVKVRKSQPVPDEEERTIISSGNYDYEEVNEFDENATLK